mgnify:CR=1 FL=1
MEKDLAELLSKAQMFETMWGFKLKIEIDLEGMKKDMEERKGRWYGTGIVESLKR